MNKKIDISQIMDRSDKYGLNNVYNLLNE
jgi:hypothetical protein